MSQLAERAAALREVTLSPAHKSVPVRAWGLTVGEWLATGPRLADLATPTLTLDRARLDANRLAVAAWAAERGVALAPHGKTTMAPQLWATQLDAGAQAITLATGWQVQVARSFDVQRIHLANAVTDPGLLAWIATELDSDADLDLCTWVDSTETVAVMTAGLAAGRRPLDVVVELGAPGGRTGARDVETALEVAAAVAASPRLRLRGVGGYEGALAHDRSEAGLAAVRSYLAEVTDLHDRLERLGAYDVVRAATPALVTAGGSAFPELVADALGPLAEAGRTTVLVRSGASLIHDDGFYASISPIADRLHSAMHGWARVVSRPEPGLALLDAGKRDLPFDEGLPVPQAVRRHPTPGAPGPAPLAHLTGEVTAMNDQHTFLRTAAGDEPGVGDVVRLGLSHPCTAFDKWRLVPVVDDVDAADPAVVDLVHTFF